MNLFDLNEVGHDLSLGRVLAQKLHPKYKPAFDRLSETDRAKAALYFLPHGSKKEILEVTRPRVLKWYCPFADQNTFPSGLRYCINVYTGCEHACLYCYVSGYSSSQSVKCKTNFRHDLFKDINDIERFDLPCAPVHLSNSTDALQQVEHEVGNTLYALQQLAENRHRFTTVTLLTKNPTILAEPRYLNVLKKLVRLTKDHPRYDFFQSTGLPPFLLECSLAFFNDRWREIFDQAAPTIKNRMDAIAFLRKEGIPVAVRIDPLFPRNPLPGGKMMSDFGLENVQQIDDLRAIVEFSQKLGVCRIIYSVLKITRPRMHPLSDVMQKFQTLYQYLSQPDKPQFRGGSWRLAQAIAQNHIIEPLQHLCQEHAIETKVCMQNLIETP